MYHVWNLDSAIGQLHDSHKAHYIGLLSMAHTENNRIPFNNKWVKKRGLFNSPVKLELFVKLGLIEILDDKMFPDGETRKPIERKKERKKERYNYSLEGKVLKKETEQVQKKVRNYVEDFLIFAQKTHTRKRGARLMLRDGLDREKIKGLLDLGLDPNTLKVAWLIFLEDESEYFQDRDGPPHNIAVFAGQIQSGRYLEQAAKRIRSAFKFSRKAKKPTATIEPIAPELQCLWADCLGEIKAKVPAENYSTWFEPTYPKTFKDGLLTIAVPNQKHRQGMIADYRELIETTLQGIRDGPIIVDFCIESLGVPV